MKGRGPGEKVLSFYKEGKGLIAPFPSLYPPKRIFSPGFFHQVPPNALAFGGKEKMLVALFILLPHFSSLVIPLKNPFTHTKKRGFRE
jgi:hypothetical protein